MEKVHTHNVEEKCKLQEGVYNDTKFKDILNHTILFKNAYICNKNINMCMWIIFKKFRIVVVATSREQVRL